MFKKIACLSLVLHTIAAFSQIPLGIGQWRTHVPYKNASTVTDAGDKIFVSANVFFFSYDKETGELQRYDKITGLSDVGVRLVDYNVFDSTLLVVYENANIDLIKQNTITNLSDIKRKQILGDKTVYSVCFRGHLAYLSCGFGIVVLDLKKVEVKDTYIIGSNGAEKKVFSFTADDLNFYAATEEGLKIAGQDVPNLANYAAWVPAQGLPARIANQAVNFNNKIFVNVNDTIYRQDGSVWRYYYSNPDWTILNLVSSSGKLLVCEADDSRGYYGRLGMLENDICCTYFDQPPIRYPLDALIDQQGIVWIADVVSGFIRMQAEEITVSYPNGPASTMVRNMDAKDGKTYVAPGGVDPAWNHSFNRDGYFEFIGNTWSSYNQYSGISQLENLLSIFEVAIHPSGNPVYFGTFWAGLLEINNGSYTLYDTTNSSLQKAAGDVARVKVTGLAFDNDANLWISNFNAVNCLSVKKNDGTWKSFQPFPLIEGGLVSQIIIDDYNQKWFIIAKGANRGIMVFDHGATIDNTNDGDRYIMLNSGGNGKLHTNEVLCLAKDLEGEIWVGTSEGITVFYCPGSIFDGCEAQQIIVTQNGVSGYLLETESVNAIAVDGANRKWVGTNNGVFVLSPDGTSQVAYFNEENSPLLSDNITDIAIDNITGEVFIGTEKGIISYRGEAIAGTEEHSEVLVFPNPVHRDYEGPIAIKGLTNNANVKITDVNGNLFYETTALGGQAVWDGRNYEGKRAKTGVYLVFTSNADGSSKHITKLLIIN